MIEILSDQHLSLRINQLNFNKDLDQARSLLRTQARESSRNFVDAVRSSACVEKDGVLSCVRWWGARALNGH